MCRFLTTSVLVVALSGCATSLMSQAPVTQTVPRHGSPQAGYACAVRAFAAMGGQPQVADPQAGVIAGVVHNAVQLNVRVNPDSTTTVQGHILPGKLAVGRMTEVEDYAALLQKEGC